MSSALHAVGVPFEAARCSRYMAATGLAVHALPAALPRLYWKCSPAWELAQRDPRTRSPAAWQALAWLEAPASRASQASAGLRTGQGTKSCRAAAGAKVRLRATNLLCGCGVRCFGRLRQGHAWAAPEGPQAHALTWHRGSQGRPRRRPERESARRGRQRASSRHAGCCCGAHRGRGGWHPHQRWGRQQRAPVHERHLRHAHELREHLLLRRGRERAPDVVLGVQGHIVHHPRCAERLRGHGRAWIKGRGAARRERGRGEGVGEREWKQSGGLLEKIQVCTASGRKARHNFWRAAAAPQAETACNAAIEALPRCQSPGRMSLNPDLLLRMPKAAVYHGTDDAGEWAAGRSALVARARYFELRCKHQRPPPSGFMVMHIGMNAAHTLLSRLFS